MVARSSRWCWPACRARLGQVSNTSKVSSQCSSRQTRSGCDWRQPVWRLDPDADERARGAEIFNAGVTTVTV